jgi:hypothetical protein
MQSQFHHIAFGTGRKRNRRLAQLPYGNTFKGPSENESLRKEGSEAVWRVSVSIGWRKR